MFALTVRRTLLVLPLASALPLATVFASTGLPARASAVPGWHVQTIVSTGTGSQGVILGLSPDSPGDAWASGVTIPSDNSPVPLIARWNGAAWSQVALPAPVQNALKADGEVSAISAASPKNVWLFGELSAWAHYDGTTWTSGRLVKPGSSGEAVILSALALSKVNVWAFGMRSKSTGGHAYAAHFNGVRWTGMSVPGTDSIAAASAINAGDIWAVEGGFLTIPGAGHGALVHWSAGAWHSVRMPKALAARPLTSVVAVSDKNVWVGGGLSNAKGAMTAAVGHWNGRAWTVHAMRAPAPRQQFEVTGLASDGHGGLWATANCERCSGYVASRVWHESAGIWKRAGVASKYRFAILTMALVPGTTSVWGVGAIVVGKKSSALIALDGNPPH
jgi:hypothetical protein